MLSGLTPLYQSICYGIVFIIIVFIVVRSPHTISVKADILKGKLKIKTKINTPLSASRLRTKDNPDIENTRVQVKKKNNQTDL